MYHQYQPMQMRMNQMGPNASVATMGPDTYQNSPYTQHGYHMGQQYQQMNQQQQEQQYLQQVRQQLPHAQQQMYQQQQPLMGQQMLQQPMMMQQGPNASLATMDPTTYQNSPFTHQQPMQQFASQRFQQPMMQMQQPMMQLGNPNASIATMGPDTYQNSPYTQHGYHMGQQYQQMDQQQQEQEYLQQVRQQLQSSQSMQQPMRTQMTQGLQGSMMQQSPNASLATMDPDTYQNSPYAQSQPVQAFRQQTQIGTQQPKTSISAKLSSTNTQNASLATMDPSTYQNSPYNKTNN